MKHILAIDIGSFKTTAIIANKENDELSISGVGITQSRGVKKGAINNIEEASKSIKQAVNEAKRIAGIDVSKAIVSISSSYTKSTYSKGVVNLPKNEINIKEINRAIQAAIYNADIPNDYIVLHAIPYNFKVDELDEIEDPDGMNGSRLEVFLHIVLAKKNGIENLKKTFKLAGIEIAGIVNTSYASSLAVLNSDEKELGVAVIDIGSTTCDISIFNASSLRYVDFIGIGSHHITQDLSIALHIPVSVAEKIKVRFEDLVLSNQDTIEVEKIGSSEKEEIPIKILAEVMSARIEETFMLLNKEISEFKDLIGSGVVLTGGFTNFFRVRDIAAAYFDELPVRIGKPKVLNGLFEDLQAPEFATAIGLLLYANGYGNKYEKNYNQQFNNDNIFSEEKEEETQIQKEPKVEEPTVIIEKIDKNENRSFIDFIKSWFKEHF